MSIRYVPFVLAIVAACTFAIGTAANAVPRPEKDGGTMPVPCSSTAVDLRVPGGLSVL